MCQFMEMNFVFYQMFNVCYLGFMQNDLCLVMLLRMNLGLKEIVYIFNIFDEVVKKVCYCL